MPEISSYPEQTSLLDTDVYILEDTVADLTKRTPWSKIKSTLKTYFDSLYGYSTTSTKTGSYVITDTDEIKTIILSGASANSTFTLPTLSGNIDRELIIFNDDSTYELNVDGNGAETIDGMTDIDLPEQGNYLKVKALSGGWIVINEAITSEFAVDTYAGYGSTDNKIVRFTNVRRNIGNMFTENHVSGYSGNTEGLEITISRSGKYSFLFSQALASQSILGMSINSSQLTTSVYTINAADRLVADQGDSTNASGSGAVVGFFNSGDIIRPHTAGVAGSPTGNTLFKCSYVGQ